MPRDPQRAKEWRKQRYLLHKEDELKSNKDWHKNNPDKSKAYYAARYQKNKEKIRERQSKYYKANRDSIIKRSLEYSQAHKAEKSAYDSKYRGINADRLRGVKQEYKKNRLKEDHLFRLYHNTSALIRLSFKTGGFSKTSKTAEILGCSFEFFKAYIEQRFLLGMGWHNRSEWHLDHIIPVSSAKTEREILKLNHYTNLRPLWAKDNLRKSNKTNEQLTLLAA